MEADCPSILRSLCRALAVCVAAAALVQNAHGQAPATQVYAGGHHACVVTPAGGVQCWGRNSEGQLGDGTNTGRSTPVQVSGLATGVVAVTAGDFHTCALTVAGGVKCWGWNLYGQLGVSGGDRNVPNDVPGLGQGVVAIEAGEFHTCALTSAGGVKCWGNNFYGEVGDGTNIYRSAPVDVLGLTSGVKRIFSGHRHTCALLANGAAKCWGANEQGQLGNGTIATNGANDGISSPVDVVAMGGPFLEISTGRFHTCALTPAGGAMCWGLDDGGELGNGTFAPNSYTAVPVAGLSSGVAHIDAGYTDTCAVLTDGSAKCWGVNDHGQLGNGRTDAVGVNTPVAVLGLASGVARISAAFQHTCALTSGGSVRCFGANTDGRLGNGAALPGADVTIASPVVGFTASVAANRVSAGGAHACELDAAGGAWCWGSNAQGQLGDGSSVNSALPVPVSGLASGLTGIVTGGAFSCAVTSAGAVKCWGSNDKGQLGTAGDNRASPADLPALASGVAALAAGWAHTCALTATGAVKCWGDNARGQLGDGTNVAHSDPVDVIGLASGVKAITAGDSHTCALLVSGGARCWGWNNHGQLGNGTTALNDASGGIAAPVDVQGIGVAIDRLSAGGYHTCAVAGGGALCWGRGDSGQIGNGAAGDQYSPAVPAGLASGVAEIAAGNSHTCALTSAGALQCWGANDDGQLGIGMIDPGSLTPVGVLGFASGGAVQVHAGFEHTCALATGGWARCWGENGSGQIGDGSVTARASQAEVMVRAQAIDFSPVETIAVGSPVPLAAATDSGLAPAFDTWTAATCAVQGNTITARSVGLCGVRAAQAGNARFFPAPSQLRILSVVKGDQTIGFNPLVGRSYGETFNVMAAATSGLPVAFSSLTPAACAVSGAVVSTTGVGTCTIAADQAGDASYNPAPRVTQSFAIAQAAQIITFPPIASRTLVDPPLTLTASASSGLPIVFSSLTPAVCTVSGPTVTLVTTGTCTIAADQPGSSNYVAAPEVTRSFVVDAAPLLSAVPDVDFGSVSMGTSSPTRTVTLTNIGSGTVVFADISTSTQFGQTNNCSTLAPGASCAINVTFQPAAAAGPINSTAVVTGTLSVGSNAAGSPGTGSLTGVAEKSMVSHYYRAILRRDPDPAGKAFWENEAARVAGLGADVNETWYAMALAFYGSPEYAAFNRDDAGFVTDLYETFFNRAPDPGGLGYWTGQIASGMPRGVVLVSFMFSPEFMSFTQGIFGNTGVRAEINTVVDFYRGLLARLPDNGGFTFWLQQFRAAQCQGAGAVYAAANGISSAFLGSAEYAQRNRTNAEYVGDLYNAFLRRGGDLGGVQFWIGQLDSAAQTRDQLRQAFVNSPEFNNRVQAIIAQGCAP